ncbi:MAG: AraC family transcriptional regulator [Cellulomonas sp.]
MTVRTEDPHEAEAMIAEMYLPSRVDHLGAGPLEVRLDAMRLDTATVGLLSFGTETRLRTVEATNYHVNLPVRGGVVSRMGDNVEAEAVPGQATVFMPDRPADILWGTDSVQLCLMIPGATLVEELEQLLGRSVTGSLEFESAMDLSSPAARSWRASLEVFRTELTDGPAFASHARVARQLERLMIDGLLLGQPHNYSDALDRGSWRPSSGPVARARELVEEQPEEPWSTSALAVAVHLSVRSLQAGFVRDVGMPPMAYLQRVRLRRVRERLREASPAQTTVAAVASGLGVSHLSRFAAAYRSAFGELPSETLRRA